MRHSLDKKLAEQLKTNQLHSPLSNKKHSISMSAAALIGVLSLTNPVLLTHAEELSQEVNELENQNNVTTIEEGLVEAVEQDALNEEDSSVEYSLEERTQLLVELHNLLDEELLEQFDLELLSNEEINEIIDSALTQSEEEIVEMIEEASVVEETDEFQAISEVDEETIDEVIEDEVEEQEEQEEPKVEEDQKVEQEHSEETEEVIEEKEPQKEEVQTVAAVASTFRLTSAKKDVSTEDAIEY